MENILISTIIRNREAKIPAYYDRLRQLVENNKNLSFSISIYENDSTDNSKEELKKLDLSIFKEARIVSENIGTKYFGSTMEDERVINFAKARNKTLEGLDLEKYDWLLIVEADVVYGQKTVARLVNRTDLDFTPDIYSGLLVMNGIAYDKWGMRRTSSENWGDVYIDFKENPIREFWSTANGICLYSMKPFKEGLKFSSYNTRLSMHDCDTAVLCEDFRARGYGKVYINQSLTLLHEETK